MVEAVDLVGPVFEFGTEPGTAVRLPVAPALAVAVAAAELQRVAHSGYFVVVVVFGLADLDWYRLVLLLHSPASSAEPIIVAAASRSVLTNLKELGKMVISFREFREKIGYSLLVAAGHVVELVPAPDQVVLVVAAVGDAGAEQRGAYWD